MAVRNYQDLIAWQKAMELVETVYRQTESFPQHELYGLRHQLRRAAVSVPSNIAEGQGRQSVRESVNFLSIAHGSLRETEAQILISVRLRYFDEKTSAGLLDLCGDVGRLVTGLANSLRRE